VTSLDTTPAAVGRRTPAQVLREARQRDSQAKRARVLQALEEMTGAGESITFAAVARTAGVSTWLVYAEGVRHHIEEAMRRCPAPRPSDRSAGHPASVAGLRTDLELARAEIRELRAERDKLRQAARLHLGQQLDQISSKDLIARIDELTERDGRLEAQLAKTTADNGALQQRVIELEDDLAAARTSLRRMIRATNQQEQET
jgi:hypothetical protein